MLAACRAQGLETNKFVVLTTHLLLDITAAESGVYENEPARRDDVIRYDDEQTDDYPPTSVKWASEAKNRFIQEATKAQERVPRTQIDIWGEHCADSGVFENTPAARSADVVAASPSDEEEEEEEETDEE
ncbi:hypothetical protein AHF37_11283 [Paragonimus kellicotti]|nr:hypothetical protein AHF37_11283 [Paragonimus kellicotti]